MKKDTNDMAIGIFDSGIGGLTVLKSIIDTLPNEDTIYLGDTARVPYGTKSAQTVTQYSLEIGGFLAKMEIKALVVACNTASAVALDTLTEAFPFPVMGMIEPAAKKAVNMSRNGRIGIIGTEGTVRSGAYEKALKGIGEGVTVVSQSCPLFVPLAEEGWVENDIAVMTAEKYLANLRENDIDTLILGCTHYPLLKEAIRDVLGSEVVLVDSGEEAAKALKELLEESGESRDETEAARKYYVTDTPERFRCLGERFLGELIDKVDHVDIP